MKNEIDWIDPVKTDWQWTGGNRISGTKTDWQWTGGN